jgi:hypothetical protein
MKLPLHESWYTHLKSQFDDPRMQQIKQAILDDKKA